MTVLCSPLFLWEMLWAWDQPATPTALSQLHGGYNMVETHTTEYGGWQNCHTLSNGAIRLIVTGDVGPRVIFFGFENGVNELFEFADDIGQTGGDEYRFYGGHRLWHAPEHMSRTYEPDNDPVQIETIDGGLRFTPSLETTTGIQKQIDITLSEDEAHVRLTHRLTNHGLWTIELAPWALTMCAPGAVGIAPLPPEEDHAANLLPRTSINLWAYTHMADLRWEWGNRVVMLRHDAERESPQKVGLFADDGWIASANHEHLLLKTFAVYPDPPHPDRGSNVELFTDHRFLEIETLGPLISLESDASVEHIEDWYLLDDIPTPHNEADVITYILPRIAAIAQGE